MYLFVISDYSIFTTKYLDAYNFVYYDLIVDLLCYPIKYKIM